jgi:hypothetical protein
MEFSFLKIVKIELKKSSSKKFLERDASSACKISLFISFTSVIGMEWTKAFLVGMDLFNTAIFSFILKYIFEEVFCASRLAFIGLWI